jgi:hypothetical protein
MRLGWIISAAAIVALAHMPADAQQKVTLNVVTPATRTWSTT